MYHVTSTKQQYTTKLKAIIATNQSNTPWKQHKNYSNNKHYYASELNWNVSDPAPLLWTGVWGELEKESASGMWL